MLEMRFVKTGFFFLLLGPFLAFSYEMRNCLYLSFGAKFLKDKNTLLSSIFKVGENNLPLFSSYLPQELRYLLFVKFVSIRYKCPID